MIANGMYNVTLSISVNTLQCLHVFKLKKNRIVLPIRTAAKAKYIILPERNGIKTRTDICFRIISGL